jgi:hypothetical protein
MEVYPTGAANEFVAQKAITTVASAKMVVEDRWTIDEKVKSTSRS